MTDVQPIDAGSQRCPWCSAELPDPAATSCPACGAALQERVDGDLPGVTQVDPTAITSGRKARRKGVRELIGLSDEETEGSPVHRTPEPPSSEVRREMLRLRIDALEAEIEALTGSLAAVRAEERGTSGAPLDEADEPEADEPEAGEPEAGEPDSTAPA